MGDFFGGGEETTTQSMEMNLKPYVESPLRRNIKRAEQESLRPYVGYDPALRVAGLTPEEVAAKGLAVDNTGKYSAYLDSMLGETQGLLDTYKSAPTAEDLTPYMNPYLSEVLGRLEYGAERQYDKDMARLGDEWINSGAYGGSRFAVEKGELSDSYLDRILDLQAQERNKAYQQAMNQYNLQNQMRGQTINQMAGLAGQGQNMLGQDINMLRTVGQDQRRIDQALADAKFAEFQREQGWDEQQINFLQNVLNPALQTTTGQTQTTVQEKEGSMFGDILGAALSIGSMAMGVPGVGAALGGAGGSLFGSLFSGPVASSIMSMPLSQSANLLKSPSGAAAFSSALSRQGGTLGALGLTNKANGGLIQSFRDGGLSRNRADLLEQMMDGASYFPPAEVPYEKTIEDFGRTNFTGSRSVKPVPIPQKKPVSILDILGVDQDLGLDNSMWDYLEQKSMQGFHMGGRVIGQLNPEDNMVYSLENNMGGNSLGSSVLGTQNPAGIQRPIGTAIDQVTGQKYDPFAPTNKYERPINTSSTGDYIINTVGPDFGKRRSEVENYNPTINTGNYGVFGKWDSSTTPVQKFDDGGIVQKFQYGGMPLSVADSLGEFAPIFTELKALGYSDDEILAVKDEYYEGLGTRPVDINKGMEVQRLADKRELMDLYRQRFGLDMVEAQPLRASDKRGILDGMIDHPRNTSIGPILWNKDRRAAYEAGELEPWVASDWDGIRETLQKSGARGIVPERRKEQAASIFGDLLNKVDMPDIKNSSIVAKLSNPDFNPQGDRSDPNFKLSELLYNLSDEPLWEPGTEGSNLRRWLTGAAKFPARGIAKTARGSGRLIDLALQNPDDPNLTDMQILDLLSKEDKIAGLNEKEKEVLGDFLTEPAGKTEQNVPVERKKTRFEKMGKTSDKGQQPEDTRGYWDKVYDNPLFWAGISMLKSKGDWAEDLAAGGEGILGAVSDRKKREMEQQKLEAEKAAARAKAAGDPNKLIDTMVDNFTNIYTKEIANAQAGEDAEAILQRSIDRALAMGVRPFGEANYNYFRQSILPLMNLGGVEGETDRIQRILDQKAKQ
jgi:hypothetical protein